jgi:hypothetical protein
VYVDNDPVVLAHGRQILEGDTVGTITLGDARDPDGILADPLVARSIDLGRPVAVMLLAVLHFVTDEDEAYGSVAKLMEAVPPGSFLVLSHTEARPEFAATTSLYVSQAAPFMARDHAQISRFFDGLDLLEPGVVAVNHWRNDDPDEGVPLLGGVARKTA